jgi:hypothetical protein
LHGVYNEQGITKHRIDEWISEHQQMFEVEQIAHLGRDAHTGSAAGSLAATAAAPAAE